MDRKDIIELIKLHQRLKIQMHHTVQFLFKVLDLSQKEMAQSVPIDPAYMRQIIRGKRTPPNRLKAVMLKQLGVDIWPYVTRDKA